jgi:prefoldin subunit 5
MNNVIQALRNQIDYMARDIPHLEKSLLSQIERVKMETERLNELRMQINEYQQALEKLEGK